MRLVAFSVDGLSTHSRDFVIVKTTAHTLCFVFALLALYPDKQETLYQHIKAIIPDGRVPVSTHYPPQCYRTVRF